MKSSILSLAVAGAALLASSAAWANHPVFVEGNCLNPPAGSSAGAACVQADYDLDGRIGIAEDEDGDRVFGTITGALGTAGVNQNGSITVVTSGVFAETVDITAANGNVTLQAAPGVEAIVDAVLQGDPNSLQRTQTFGIQVNSPEDRYVIIRNLTVRNWAVGIRTMGVSRVAIEQVRLENNAHFGIQVRIRSEVKIDQSQVMATGFRAGAGGNYPTGINPNPGDGINFSGDTDGAVFRTEISGNFRAGIFNTSSGTVTLRDVYLFDNNPNTVGVDE